MSNDQQPQGQPEWQPTNPPTPPGPPPAAPATKSWFARHKILTGILALVLLGLIIQAAGGGDSGTTASTNTSVSAGSSPSEAAGKTSEAAAKTSEAAPAPKAAAIGSKVRDGKFEFVVTKVESGKASIGDEFLNEKAQGTFTLISVTVTNIGEEPQFLSDSNQKVKDAAGREFSPNSGAAIYIKDNDVLFNEINPGNTVKGVLVYDMPKGAKPASIELHDSAFSGGVTVKLG